MKHTKKLLFFAIKISLIGMLVLTGCSAINNLEEQQTPQPKEVQITEDGLACGSGTELNVGDTLVLILNGNPSTGYTWDVGFYVHPVIEPLGEPGYQPDSDLLGAAGSYTFRFLAIGEGQATLRMIYHRPLDKDIPVLKICDVSVTVKKDNSIQD